MQLEVRLILCYIFRLGFSSFINKGFHKPKCFNHQGKWWPLTFRSRTPYFRVKMYLFACMCDNTPTKLATSPFGIFFASLFSGFSLTNNNQVGQWQFFRVSPFPRTVVWQAKTLSFQTSPYPISNVRWLPPGCLRWRWPRGRFCWSVYWFVRLFLAAAFSALVHLGLK